VQAAYFGKAPWPVRTLIAPQIRRGVIKGLVARDVWRAGPEACWDRFAKLLDQLDARAPDRGFWVGPSPSVADLAIFAQLHGLRTRLTRAQADALAARPRLAAYLDRVDAATQPAAADPRRANAPAKPATRAVPASAQPS
jgi:glutathione S-transferase